MLGYVIGLIKDCGVRYNHQDVEDLVHDTWLKFFGSYDRTRSPGVATFLRRTARSVVIDWMRGYPRGAGFVRAGIEIISLDDATRRHWLLSQLPHCDAHSETKRTADRIIDFVYNLPGRDRTIMSAWLLDGQTKSLIAKSLGMSRRNVAARVEKCVLDLRQFLTS